MKQQRECDTLANRLKNLRLTSVDLVKAGANQEADICLYKSLESTGQTEPLGFDDIDEVPFDEIEEIC